MYDFLLFLAFILLVSYFLLNGAYQTVMLALLIFVVVYVSTGSFVGIFL